MVLISLGNSRSGVEGRLYILSSVARDGDQGQFRTATRGGTERIEMCWKCGFATFAFFRVFPPVIGLSPSNSLSGNTHCFRYRSQV